MASFRATCYSRARLVTQLYEIVPTISTRKYSVVPTPLSHKQPNLTTLSRKVNDLSSQIKSHLDSLNHPDLGFSTSAADVPSTTQYETLRDRLNDAASDLLLLINGPKTRARRLLCTHHDLAAYQVAFDYDFFTAVPERESIALSELAVKTGLDEGPLGRVLRLLCTQRMFEEVKVGRFAHTASSIIFARDEQLKAAGGYQLDEMFQAAGDTATTLRTQMEEPEKFTSPFQHRHGVPLFKYYERQPKLASRFAKAMAGITKLDRQIAELQDGFPWRDVQEGKIVVDIGGGSGHVSMELIRTFPNLRIVVQDASRAMLAQSESQASVQFSGRISFMHHNFFDVQPIEDAGVYFLRQVLHNWSDDKCVSILKALVPAMKQSKPGTPLLINDTLVPEPGSVTRFEEHGVRQVDMMMLVALGAKQRTVAEFERLLHRADERFQIKKVHGTSSMGLLEVQLD